MRAGFVFLAIVFLGLAGGVSYAVQTHTEVRTIHVVSKERLLQVDTDKDGSSSSYKNFVYTDNEAYVVQDSLWNGHFTAGTVYAQIHANSNCLVTLAGYRFGFLSMYQNIIAAKCSA
jgi:hypothetical protein